MSVGAVFDRYRLVCPLARGGMGAVWLARLDGAYGMEKLVALKTILPDYASDLRFRNMFLDEARLAARISHPNVATVLEIGEAEGNLFYVMDWVDGEPLGALQKACAAADETIPVGIAVRILADTCLGLHAAHELRNRRDALLDVVHRDVSPQNILITDDGIPRLIDFGIAKARARLSCETSEGTLKGRFEYIAPEQASGGVVDRRTDVWGAGAVLYHLLAGKAVFDGDVTILAKSAQANIRPEPLPESVPAPIAAVIMRAVSPPVEERYATALEMTRALEAAMRDSALHTTRADVAAFIGERLAGPREGRRRSIGRALAESRALGATTIATTSAARSSLSQSGTRLTSSRAPGDTPAALGASEISIPIDLPASILSRRWRLIAALGVVLVSIVTALAWAHRAPPAPRAPLQVAAATTPASPIPPPPSAASLAASPETTSPNDLGASAGAASQAPSPATIPSARRAPERPLPAPKPSHAISPSAPANQNPFDFR